MRHKRVLADADAVADEAAARFVGHARSAIAAKGRFVVALSGGSTPRALYMRLTPAPIDWTHVHVCWSDERCVSPDRADSNYRLAYDTLLSKVPIPPENVHRLRGELDPAQAAADYEDELRGLLPDAQFDLVLLGLGADAHTASLFPGTGVVHETDRWVIGHFVEKLNAYRLTLTPPILNRAAHLLFLVVGADKAAAVRSVWRDPFDPDRFPAQVIMPLDGEVTWLLDRAASNLDDTAS